MIDEMVKEFCVAVGQPVPERPTMPSDELLQFRAKLICEEFAELMEAMGALQPELIKLRAACSLMISSMKSRGLQLHRVAAESVDLDYVVSGTRVSLGIDGAPVLAGIHAANMRKLGGPKCPTTGKQLKPKGWQPFDVESCIAEQCGEGR